MAAKKKQIPLISLEDLGFAKEELSTQLEFTKIECPSARQAGRVLGGTPEEAARQLVEVLRKEAKVI
jgi:electron transfer flavoprotein beta subunit